MRARIELHHLYLLNELERKSVGARYMPGFDPNSPNIEIRSLSEEFESLGLFGDWKNQLNKSIDSFSQSFRDLDQEIIKLSAAESRMLRTSLTKLKEIGTNSIEKRQILNRDLNRRLSSLKTWVRNSENRISELDRKSHESTKLSDSERRVIENSRRTYTRLHNAIFDLEEYLRAGPGRFLGDSSILLLEGAGGTGKTHFLCDIAVKMQKLNLPVIFMTAKSVGGSKNPLTSLCSALKFSRTETELLEQLDALGRRKNCRTLILVDAINEDDIKVWSAWISRMTTTLRDFPNIALGVTCRTPHEDMGLTSRANSRIRKIEHPGFDGVEFDAQTAFFDFYGIDAIAVPLLTPEFSNPMMLKIVCESVKHLDQSKKRKSFDEITSGQKGMNKIFERFAVVVGEEIESQLGLPPGFCWRMLKGAGGKGSHIGLSGSMAEREEIWLNEQEVFEVFRNTPHFVLGTESKLLAALLKAGLLISVEVYKIDGFVEEYGFSYQRFGDHLIARYLMNVYLRTETISSVKRSFYKNRKLGRMFDFSRGGSYSHFGNIASAVMTDFPERVKKLTGPHELISYLPLKSQNGYYLRDIFLESLEWRSINKIFLNSETFAYLAYYLESADKWTQNQALETLVQLGIRKNATVIAEYLYSYLSQMSLAERDLTWSEYLRSRSTSAAIFRLLTWLEQHYLEIPKADIARSHVVLLYFTLTSTSQNLRDRATRALMRVGTIEPSYLLGLFDEILSLNDIYILERYLAAVYGLYLNVWTIASATATGDQLVKFAKKLHKHFFDKQQRSLSSHILIIEYLRGIIEYAAKIDSTFLPKRALEYICNPTIALEVKRVRVSHISNTQLNALKGVLRGDFFNYTLGDLVEGRSNYDHSNKTYLKYRSFVGKRMVTLGYTTALFENVDRAIASRENSFRRSGKTERYAKKYARIAYYELCGSLKSLGKIPHELPWDRSDETDIDPSFPQENETWTPVVQDLFKSPKLTLVQWLEKGPVPELNGLIRHRLEVDGQLSNWIVLQAEISRHGSAHREVWMNINSIFCKAKMWQSTGRSRLKSFFEEYRFSLNETPTFTFAGEIPLANRFQYCGYSEITEYKDDLELHSIASGLQAEEPNIIIPIVRWVWSGSNSAVTDSRSAFTLSPKLCVEMDLINRPGSFDLFKRDGTRVSLYREVSSANSYHRDRLLLINEEVLRDYLKLNKWKLVWDLSGERTMSISDLEGDRREAVLKVLRGRRGQNFTSIQAYGSRTS